MPSYPSKQIKISQTPEPQPPVKTLLACRSESAHRKLVRRAIEDFYATLSDEQKGQFEAIGPKRTA
jgi:hypothetical protein